jgi:hypothetical protein
MPVDEPEQRAPGGFDGRVGVHAVPNPPGA